MNLEKEGIPTVCVITTAFQTIAEAQQQALGYPDLTFVMLAHPVAVATDDEIDEKVEAIYPDLVRKLTGGIAPIREPVREEAGEGGGAASPGAAGVLEEAIAPIRDMLRADGADLAVASRENGTLTMKLIFLDNVCEECILPGKDLAEMIGTACRESGHDVSEVVLRDPRDEA